GQHWPLCNGQIIPRAPLNSTIIEFSHRLTSGIAVVSVLMLVLWAFRAFPRGHAARWGALLAITSTFIECAIGAALVLLRLVGTSQSLARGLWLGAHLVNTLVLLAALSFTAWHATHRGRPIVLSPVLMFSVIGFLGAAVLGGFAALGDTLTSPA